MPALVIGAIGAGVVCYFACTLVKTRFGYDDSLDAFGVHGVARHTGRDSDRRVRHPGHRGHCDRRQARWDCWKAGRC